MDRTRVADDRQLPSEFRADSGEQEPPDRERVPPPEARGGNAYFDDDIRIADEIKRERIAELLAQRQRQAASSPD
jgi:hypothetical protein